MRAPETYALPPMRHVHCLLLPVSVLGLAAVAAGLDQAGRPSCLLSECDGTATASAANAEYLLLMQKQASGSPKRHVGLADGQGLLESHQGKESNMGRKGEDHSKSQPSSMIAGWQNPGNTAYQNYLAGQKSFASGGPQAVPNCNRDTGKTCNFGDCWLYQGPTQCVKTGIIFGNKCFCPPGYCPNDDGVCVAAFGSVQADIVPVNAASPTFPGPHSKVNTGMCFSGGGIRALTWAIGGLRPLVEWDLMSNVDIISSVSGGSWANAIFMFAPGDTSEIIGGPTNPAALFMQVLGEDPAPAIKTCTNDYMWILARLFFNGAPLDLINEFFACEAFLRPFGLCDFFAYMAPNAEAVERIRRANPALANATFQVPRADRPRAMVIEGTLLAPWNYETAPEDEVTLQMSPDHVGSPFYPEGSESGLPSGYITYTSLIGNSNETRLVGGGLLEAFAFGGAPFRGGQGGGTQEVGAPAWPFSLAQAIGISSMAPGAALGNIPVIGKLAEPKYNYFSVTDSDHSSEHGALVTKVSDGGNEENSGLLSLLQRGAKRVVWFAASYKLVNRSYNLCDLSTAGNELIEAGIIDQVLDKFGYGPELTNGRVSNALLHNQVFKRERVHNVACQLQQHLTDGTPPVLNFVEEVLPNSWWGITGGWQVEVVLVYLEHSKNFYDLLPVETKRQLDLGQKGAFPSYPAYPTTLGGGTNAQYNLLAATSEYFVRQNKDLFARVLG